MAALSKPKIVVIGGPTASGKTSLSVTLAKKFGGEIISADSMQIYRGLDVGTAKASAEEQQGIPHHLLDILAPEESFSVADYVARASGCIEDITARGRLPFIVGGTGLYISSLIDGISFAEQPDTSAVRAELMARVAEEGIEPVYNELKSIDPEAAASIHPNNIGRVVRALELYKVTGKTMSQQKADSRPAEKPYDALCICLGGEDRQALYARIDRRVDAMLNDGILEEAKLVYDNRERYRTAAQAIGYKEFFPYFEGTAALEEAAAKLKQASRNYAKRQLTWFKRMEAPIWLDGAATDVVPQAEKLIRDFLLT